MQKKNGYKLLGKYNTSVQDIFHTFGLLLVKQDGLETHQKSENYW